MYEKRFYRNITRSTDLLCYEVRYKETDLWCCTKTDLRKFIEDRVFFIDINLRNIFKRGQFLKRALYLLKATPCSWYRQRDDLRVFAGWGGAYGHCSRGIAEFLGRDISPLTDEYIIENGGDISIKTFQERMILVYAKSPLAKKLRSK